MTRYALVIGIQKYGGSGFGDLEKPVQDAEAIAKILEAHGDFVEVTRLPSQWNGEKQCHEVVEADLKGEDLDNAIMDFFAKVGSNEALIYFSGHGAQVTKLRQKKGYLVTSDCTSENVASAGIALENLNGFILGADFSSLVVLLDCCHSGTLLEKSQISSALGTFRTGDRNYFLATACRSHEKAYEGEDYSLFTAAVIKALKSPSADGRVRTALLNKVIDEELRGSGQEPVVLKSGGEITLVTYASTGKIEADSSDKLQNAIEKLRSDYEILDAAFFELVAAKVANNQARTQILKLRAANWSMLFQKNYVERDQQGEALEKALQLSEDYGISLMLIRGEPGAGKTALLRWLAYKLFCQGKRVFHKKNQNQVGWLEQLREFSEESGGEHFYVIADDLFRDDSFLEELQQNEFLFPLTLIGTTRQNEDRHYELKGLEYETVCLNLAKPSAVEKKRVLALPEVQSHLAGKSNAERQQLMDSPTMLVLMLQLSEGKTFDLVLQNIVKNLPHTDRQAFYQAFGVLCSFFQYGVMVPFEILLLCMPDSNCSERLILSGLEGLIDTANYSGYEGLTPIHELIAKTVMELDYRPDESQNQPYAWVERPCLLERHLRVIIPQVNANHTHQKWWVGNSLLKLVAKNSELDLVRKILQDYSLEIETIQQQISISHWGYWTKIYTALGWSDKQKNCLRSILATKPEDQSEWVYWLSIVKRLGSREQQQAIAQTQSWLDNHPDDSRVRVNYLALVAQLGSREQQQAAIDQTQSWLDNHPDDSHVRVKYLALVAQLGSREQQAAIDQTQSWLDNHPDERDVRLKYLALVAQLGSREQQAAIAQTQSWLDNHPDDSHVRLNYLALVAQVGSREQQQETINQIQSWLDNHPDEWDVRVKYLALVAQVGSREQQQAAIDQIQSWLDNHPDERDVRLKYLPLVAQLGSREQQAAIDQIQSWLDNHPDERDVRLKYLPLVAQLGSREQQQVAINQIQSWLDNHPDDSHVRVKYLALVAQLGSREQQQAAINQTQSWLDNHPDERDVRLKYLALVAQLGSREQQQETINQIQSWLDNHPDDSHVRLKYLALVAQLGSREQQAAIAQTQSWLDTHPDNEDARVKYLSLIAQLGSGEQQQQAIVQTQSWLDTHPDNKHVRVQYLILVTQLGSREQQQQAIAQTQSWLDTHPDDWHVRRQYLGVVTQLGSREQQQEAIAQTQSWLNTYPDNGDVRVKYLSLIAQLGSQEQQQQAIFQTQSWLNTYPDNGDVRVKYLAFIAQLGSREQQQQAIFQTQSWLDTHPDNGDVRVKYLAFIAQLGSQEQQQQAIFQTQSWLDTHPEDWHVRISYLALVEKLGSREQQQQAIFQTQSWLDTHPDKENIFYQYLELLAQFDSLGKLYSQPQVLLDNHSVKITIRIKFLTFVEQFGSQEQQRATIIQTQTWLDNHPDDATIRIKFLTFVEQFGSREQQQAAIIQTKTWLDNHPHDATIRIKFLTFVEQFGSREQQQAAIIQTKTWLDNHPHDATIRIKFLTFVEQFGSREQQQAAIIQTKTWLDNHPHEGEVCIQYLHLIDKSNESRKNIEPILRQQWQWIVRQQGLDQKLWDVFLKTVYKYSLSDLYLPAINLALKDCSNETSIICFMFEVFRSYLDQKTFHFLATSISQLHLPPDKWINYIHITIFFRDIGDNETVLAIYKKLIGITKKRIKQFPDLQQTINYLFGISSKNSSIYIKPLSSSQKEIQVNSAKNSYFYQQLGYFCRYAADDIPNAHRYFEQSLAQKLNFLSCIELAELEAAEGNIERAKVLLESGLALIPITHPEKEEREKLGDRITALQILLNLTELKDE